MGDHEHEQAPFPKEKGIEEEPAGNGHAPCVGMLNGGEQCGADHRPPGKGAEGHILRAVPVDERFEDEASPEELFNDGYDGTGSRDFENCVHPEQCAIAEIDMGVVGLCMAGIKKEAAAEPVISDVNAVEQMLSLDP